MIRLSNMIPAHRLLDLEPTDHLPALEKLIHAALPQESSDTHFHALEEIRSKSNAKEINLGKGFALSHARLDYLTTIEIAVGLFRQETQYLKGEPVHTVFCIMIPTDKARTYLTLMARLSRFLLQPGIDEIFLSGNHTRILDALEEFDNR
ncbi:MAG: PTS sugar transporter subunit IIA [Spirochaeta sp.]